MTASLSSPQSTQAADGNWIVTSSTSGNWSDTSNWEDGIIADGAGYTATIAPESTGTARAIILNDASRTLGGLTINYQRRADTSGSLYYTFSNGGFGHGFVFDNNGATATLNLLGPSTNITNYRTTIDVPITLSDSLEISDSTSGPVIINGNIDGAGGLTYTGTSGSSLTLTGTNTFTGGLSINNSEVIIGEDYNLGDESGVITINGGILHNAANVSGDGTVDSYNRQYVIGSEGATFNTDGKYYHIRSGSISGDGPLIKTGSSTLAMYTGVENTYTGGTIIREGNVRIEADSNLGASTSGVTLDGGTLIVRESTQLDAGRTFTITENGGTIDGDAFTNINGVIEGDGLLNLIGDSTISFNNAGNTHSGGIDVGESVILRIRRGDASLGATGNNLTFADGTSFSVNNYDSVTEAEAEISASRFFALTSGTVNFIIETDTPFSATINGSGKLLKTDDAILNLKAANSYSGGTEVETGTLLANNTTGSATGSGAVLVKSGATLGGGGIIQGATTLESGATLNVDGNLRFSNALQMAGTTMIDINGTTRGSGYDAVDVSGLLSYGGDLSIVFLTSAQDGYTYQIFSILGGYDGTFNSISIAGVYDNIALLYDGNGIWTGTDGTASFTFDEASGSLNAAVPEPATFALMLGGAILGLMIIRRRRK
nr:autotransporter-associated beta strand repeat-containing protein [Ruficoccus amylovorans]